LKDTELAMARAADRVITVTDAERLQLNELGIDEVSVIPTIHDSEPHTHYDYSVRSGIVFIGGYGHTPNVDAVIWLCNEIMPIVWRELPEIHVTLLGNSPPPSVLALRSDRVLITGFVANVSPYFEEARLFVAPLRYGAGMKGKVGHALSFGLPIVATSVATEGFDLADGENCLIADDTASFAQAIVRLYGDRSMWERLSENGTAAIHAVGQDAVSTRLRELFAALGVASR
jgi:glycosyltransferase involved in cell wall biosynthesis